ncbi:hypothetical protein BJ165DRAFT_1524094 [Panaeolus papilionaceus]|nr:hypothetical protein BJ165DRAFT_1524094 [Panaeolus papilionaceus]
MGLELEYDSLTGLVSIVPSLPKEKMGRQDAKNFTPIELSILRTFKAPFCFIDGKDKKTRHAFLQDHIFPAILTHWYQHPDTELQGRTDGPGLIIWTKHIADYVTNNWRSKVSLYKSPTLTISYTNFMYNHYTTHVIEEIKTMLTLGENLTSRFILDNRHKAAKAIRDRMELSDRRLFEDALMEARRKGYMPEVQVKMWKKHGKQRIKQDHQKQYLEFGIASLQFCGNLKDGRVLIEPIDNIAHTIGCIGAESFFETYQDQLMPFMTLLGKYIQDMRDHVFLTKTQAASGHQGSVAPLYDGTIVITKEGFPILPIPWRNNVAGAVLKMYWKRFISTHYNLAKGTTNATVPFATLAKNLATYIDPKYLPNMYDFKFVTYQAMPVHVLQAFFTHVAQRQEIYGPEDSFRFSNTYSSSKAPIVVAFYPGQHPPATMVPANLSAPPDAYNYEPQFRHMEIPRQTKVRRQRKDVFGPGATQSSALALTDGTQGDIGGPPISHSRVQAMEDDHQPDTNHPISQLAETPQNQPKTKMPKGWVEVPSDYSSSSESDNFVEGGTEWAGSNRRSKRLSHKEPAKGTGSN